MSYSKNTWSEDVEVQLDDAQRHIKVLNGKLAKQEELIAQLRQRASRDAAVATEQDQVTHIREKDATIARLQSESTAHKKAIDDASRRVRLQAIDLKNARSSAALALAEKAMLSQRLRAVEQELRMEKLKHATVFGSADVQKKCEEYNRRLAELQKKLIAIKEREDKVTLREANEQRFQSLKDEVIGKKNLDRAKQIEIQHAYEEGRSSRAAELAQYKADVEDKDRRVKAEIEAFAATPALVVPALKGTVEGLLEQRVREATATNADCVRSEEQGYYRGWWASERTRQLMKAGRFDLPEHHDDHPMQIGKDFALRNMPIALAQEGKLGDTSWDTRKVRTEWKVSDFADPCEEYEEPFWHSVGSTLVEKGWAPEEDEEED